MTNLLDTFIENRYRVHPNHANSHETVHGGNVMKWMDMAGALSATRHAHTECVTASIDQMDFHRPVPVGDTVLIRSYVYDVGRTSIRVRLQAFRENPRTGEQERTTESRFVFVAVDESGSPVEVSELDVESERGQRLRQEAIDAQNGE